MIRQTATAEDFANWTKAAKAADWDALIFVIKDCREAAEAARSMGNADREGYYADQAHTYADEKRRRLNSKKGS